MGATAIDATRDSDRATEDGMPTARIESATGPIELYYEETGQGFPLIWYHER